MRRQFVAQEAPEGTKFKLFPQAPWLQGYAEPEIVRVSAPAGSLGPGPSDGRMYVIDPVDKALGLEFLHAVSTGDYVDEAILVDLGYGSW